MYAHMNRSILSFLEKIVSKHALSNYFFMQQALNTSIYYESNRKKTIFSSGRSYDILFSTGEFIDKGYITLDNIPVTEDSVKIFEAQFKDNNLPAFSMPGFVAYRLLKPLKGNIDRKSTRLNSSHVASSYAVL